MQTSTESGLIEKLDLFKFFQEFFNRSSSSNYDNISPKVKTDHSFMLKRYLSIRFPELIQMFNKINSATTIDAIRLIVVPEGSSKSPGWMYLYTKAKKNGSVGNDVNEIMQKYSDETLEHFFEKHELGHAEFEQYLEFFYLDAIKQLDNLESQLNKKAKTSKR